MKHYISIIATVLIALANGVVELFGLRACALVPLFSQKHLICFAQRSVLLLACVCPNKIRKVEEECYRDR